MGVKGIGGLFFRARDPDGLAAWYRAHLNVGAGCVADPAMSAEPWIWKTEGGGVVFAPLPENTAHLAADRGWMLNLRVDGLDTLVAALRGAGTEVQTRDEWDTAETGRFARLHDPEGNPIELWQPPG